MKPRKCRFLRTPAGAFDQANFWSKNVKNFEKANGIKIKYKIVARRPGDIATCYSNPEKAKRELGWKTEKTLKDMCKDSWTYIQKKQNKE